MFHETSHSRSAEAGASAPVALARRSRWLKTWRSWLSAIALRFSGRRHGDVEKLEEIKDAHWELADCASHYRQFLDAQQDFIVRRSGDGHVVFANAAFCNAFDVRREDVVGSMFQPPVVRTEVPAKPSAQSSPLLNFCARATVSAGLPGTSRKSGTISANRKSKALAVTSLSNALRKRG